MLRVHSSILWMFVTWQTYSVAVLTMQAGAAGKRFICNAASIPLLEIADILHQNFSARGYRIPTRIIPDVVVRIYALFIPKGRIIVDSLQQSYSLSTEQARSVFGSAASSVQANHN